MHTTRLGTRWTAFALALLLLLGGATASAQDGGALPPTARLTSPTLTHVYQTWNNCSGANLTMALSYYGWTADQDVARAWLKPDMEDKNVSPWEMAEYVNQVQTTLPNLRAVWRFGGDMDVVKRAVAAGFPIIIESGFDVEDLGWMGHYETIVAYDDATRQVWVYDSYLGPNMVHSYDDLLSWWRHFDYAYVLLYPAERVEEVKAVLGPSLDPQEAARIALERARAQATADRSDGWAWFNMGTSYVKLGDYGSAALAFDQAFQLGMPYRTTWYQFAPFEAYYHTQRYQDVLTLVANTEATTTYVEELYYWRGAVHVLQGENEQALAEFNRALSFNPNFHEAQAAIAALQAGTFQPDAVHLRGFTPPVP